MKKIAILLIIAFSIFLLPLPVFAVDFSIENTEINAHLQENGDVQVTEQHIYQFDDDFNGITRTLIPKEQTQIVDFQASENGNTLDVEQEENFYNVYRSGSYEEVEVELSYTITNGVEVFSDFAQFYWPFFDTSNESNYENMNIYVHPPQPTEEEVLALGYDEAFDTSTIDSDGVVHFAMGKVDSGTNGDIRVAYDTSLFPTTSLLENKTIGEEIAADKSRFEAEAAAFESRQDILNRISPYIVGVFIIYLVVLLFRALSIKSKKLWEVERSSSQSLYLPKQEMSLPATILYMRNMSANTEFLSAALLDLVRKGYVQREDDNKFTVVDENTDHQHESILINWLFYKIGDNGNFSLKALEAYTKIEDNHSTYNGDFHKWIQAVKSETNDHDLVDKQQGIRWTSAVASFLLIPFIIMLGVHSLFIWMVLSIFISLTLLLFAVLYQPKTVQGLRIKKQWANFSSNYDNISEQEWNQWMSDEQMQAFIYALGTGNKSMQKKSEHLSNGLSSTAHTDSSLQTNDIVMFILIASTINNQFDKANSTVVASTSSSDGGVPGGGAGVGGGGGGSGAF
ncbi:DUF2207 domain-containing protein [Gracilibacillus massiliensis]|uniref:DUF2207 domain-containing protein n=1 Tax=Gracilibacillus massiliensis TaxID=1564956 RepID=UPI00071D1A60|nr:DUF2207 domain-containing protein [Gracilibacillus massiliensis]